MVNLFNSLGNYQTVFQSITPFYIPTESVQGSDFSMSLLILIIAYLFSDFHPSRSKEVYLIMVLICISLRTNDIEHFYLVSFCRCHSDRCEVVSHLWFWFAFHWQLLIPSCVSGTWWPFAGLLWKNGLDTPPIFEYDCFSLDYRSSLYLYPFRLTSHSGSHRDPNWDMQFQGSGREGKRAGETQGAGVSKHEFLRGRCWCNWPGVCTVPFLRWQKVLGLSAEKATVTHSHSDRMAEIDSPRFSSLFLAISVHLSFTSLVLGWNWSVTFAWCPERGNWPLLWGSWPLTVLFLSRQGGFFPVGSSLVVLSNGSLGDEMMQAKFSCLPSLLT